MGAFEVPNEEATQEIDAKVPAVPARGFLSITTGQTVSTGDNFADNARFVPDSDFPS